MYPDLSYSEAAASATPAQVLGFQNKHVEVSEMVAAEKGCKCGGGERSVNSKQSHHKSSIFKLIRKMSCCGGSCGCGPNCKCGDGCKGCGMYPDLSYSEAAASATPAQVLGFQNKHVEVSEMVAAEKGCKCGGNCNCSTCSNCN